MRRHRTAASSTKAHNDRPASRQARNVTPLKPRPLLLAVLSVIFALWVGFLIVLYFTTIKPR